MTIREVEETTGMKRSHIRFYEREGLFRPKRRDGSQYRDYDAEDLEELRKIRFLRMLGFSVEKIREMRRGSSEWKAEWETQEQSLRKQQEELELSVHLCERLSGVRNWEELPMDEIEAEEIYWKKGGREWEEKEKENTDLYETFVMGSGLSAVVFLFGGLLLWPFVIDYADAGIPAPLFLDGSILFLASLLMLVFTRLAYSWRRGRSLVCLILTAFWIYGIGTLVGVPVYYLSVG